MKRIILFPTLVLLAGLVAVAIATSSTNAKTTAAAAFQIAKTVPLYRYQSRMGYYLYTTSSTLPQGLSDGPWESEGIACHVANMSHQIKAVYSLTKSDERGVRYFLTDKAAEAESAQKSGWSFQKGAAFYVASAQLPGSVPLHRLYKPVTAPPKKSLLEKIGDLVAGEKFRAAPGLEDAHFYTAREDERESAQQAGYVYEGTLGFVWLSPQPPPPALLPDLLVKKTEADNTSVTIILQNQGKANTGGAPYEVTLLVFDSKDKFLYKITRPGAGLSPNQFNQVKIETGGRSLSGNHYQVKVDEANTLEESNESNNETGILNGPGLKIKPLTDAERAAFTLSFSMKDKQERLTKVGQREVKVIDYIFTVDNADSFPKEWFQTLDVLASMRCGTGESKARLIAEIKWQLEKDGHFDKAGVWIRDTCKPLMSLQDLATIKLSIPEERGVPDKVMIVVRDRLTGIAHESSAYLVGAFGIGKLLFPLGCKSFLGRNSDFLCTSHNGFAACENLRKQGKPLTCRMAGKKEP
jgi:hypothetical protein